MSHVSTTSRALRMILQSTVASMGSMRTRDYLKCLCISLDSSVLSAPIKESLITHQNRHDSTSFVTGGLSRDTQLPSGDTRANIRPNSRVVTEYLRRLSTATLVGSVILVTRCQQSRLVFGLAYVRSVMVA